MRVRRPHDGTVFTLNPEPYNPARTTLSMPNFLWMTLADALEELNQYQVADGKVPDQAITRLASHLRMKLP